MQPAPEDDAAANLVSRAAWEILTCCRELAFKQFACKHTWHLRADDLRVLRQSVMRLIRHRYAYDASTDHLWLCAISHLRLAHGVLLNCDDAWSVWMEEERLYLDACVVHLHRKIFNY